jgi:hypothetical protein
MEDLGTILVSVGLIIATAWVVGIIVLAFKDKANLRTRADLYNRLLDKFSTATEFVDYLKSDSGQKLIDEITIKNTSVTAKILGSIQKGIILTLLGVGLLILGNIFGGSLGGDLYIVLSVAGTIAFVVGIGFLISTGISYRLSKSLGLLEVEKKSSETNHTVKNQTVTPEKEEHLH